MAKPDESVAVRRTAFTPDEIAQMRGRVLDANGNVWFGPGPAPSPAAPATENPRRFDYPFGWNILRQPENAKAQDAGVTFAILRGFAEQTIVRAAIETCKDDDETVEYVFTLTPEPGERKAMTAKRVATDPRIKEVTEFFRSPDKRHDFATWRRLAWEEILVCDNLSLYWWPYEFPLIDDKLAGLVRNREGEPYAIRIIDGDTIEPLIDDSGYEPAPPDPAYDQWIKGSPRKQFSADLLLYAPFNPRVKKVFGYSPVEQLLFYIDIAIRRDMTKRAHYTDGNIPTAFWSAPEDWTPDQIKTAQQWLNMVCSTPEQRSKMIYMPGGKVPPIFPQDKLLQDSFDEWLAMLTGWIFGVPVTSLIKQQNRATAQTSKEQATEEGRAARVRKMTRLLTRIVSWAFGPEYANIVATTRQQLETDPDIQSQIDDRGVKNGTLQIDEIREREGREPYGLPKGVLTPAGYLPFGSAALELDENGDPIARPTAARGEDEAADAQQGAAQGARQTVAADAILNGAQLSAATAIVTAVAAGEIPRDSGIGQIEVLFHLTNEQAERLMGSAGTKTPTTTNPRPDQDQATPPAPSAAAAPPAREPAAKVRKVDFVVDPKKLEAAIRKIIRKDADALKEAARSFIERSILLGATNDADDGVRIVAIDSAQVRAFIEQRENLIVTVNETTADAILSKIAELQEDGLTPDGISDAIRETFDLRDEQADLISRQEVGSSLNGGRFLQMEEEGVDSHEWMTTIDGRERDSHAALDGEIVKVGEPFSNGLRYPQDPDGAADETIGCRCITVRAVAQKAARSAREKRWRAAVKGSKKIEREMTQSLREFFAAQHDRIMAAITE